MFALQLRGISAAEYKHEIQCATRYVEKSRSRPYAFLSNDCPMNFFAVESTSSSSHEPFRKPECLPQEFYFCFDRFQYFPLDKDCRPLNEAGLVTHAKEVEEAQLKELSSWLQHRVGKPVLKTDFEKRTGLKAMTSRMLKEFKKKEGKTVVKCRLALRGFQEQNQKSLATSSPTATKLGHRIVMQTAADNKWSLEGWDISTAFLQGFSFDNLPSGMKRQPCGFVPPPGVFKLLAQLDPATWQEAASNPDAFIIELCKSVYGLKDAPLLWFVAIDAFLREYGMKPTAHDPCVYKLCKNSSLVLLLSLHVDDTLCSGLDTELTALHSALQKRFGTVKREIDVFRHFWSRRTPLP